MAENIVVITGDKKIKRQVGNVSKAAKQQFRL